MTTLTHLVLAPVELESLDPPVSITARREIERRRLEMAERCGEDRANAWADSLLTNRELRHILGIA